MKLSQFANPALRLDLLQPGDVILSAGKSKRSKANILLQGQNEFRHFSHAAIVIEPCRWMESLDDGVLFTPIRVDKIEEDGAGYRVLHFLNESDYSSMSVFRHPKLAALPGSGRWEHVSQTLNVQGYLEFGKEYSELCSLAAASPYLRDSAILHRAALVIALLAQRINVSPKRWNPGLFCSQLVASLYLGLKENVDPTLSLLNEARAPFQISPSDLADPALTNLNEVRSVLIDEQNCPDLNLPKRWPMAQYFIAGREDNSRATFVVKSHVSTMQFMEACERLEKSFQEILDPRAIRGRTQERKLLDDTTAAQEAAQNARIEQQFINTLWSQFDKKAADENWDALRMRMEISHASGQYNSFRISKLRDEGY